MKELSRIRVNAGHTLYPLEDTYGIFFEDINHAADGGIYAELVQNRSFEFCNIDNKDYTNMTAWEPVERDGGIADGRVECEYPMNVNNTHYYRLRNQDREGKGYVGIMNLGYNTGIPLRAGEEYKFSMFARRDINFKSPVEIRLESSDGKLYGSTTIYITNSEWTKYEAVITPDTEDYAGRLVILMKDKGWLCMDMISMFPKNTFNGRENGLRADIAQFLADIKPAFMRFPGGCLVHGGSLDDKARNAMYRWKNTIGPVEARPSKRNHWSYNQTYGFGYYEFFCFCEDIGAKPLPVLPGALDPHSHEFVPMDEMQAWVDDTLEFLEFANGSAESKWGRIRAQMGHPAPFNIEYIAIGNEEVDEIFFERYPLFHNAIAEKYPDIKILNTAGPWANGKPFDMGWESARKNNSYAVDEHYYVQPEWLLAHYDRYASDFYTADGPKVFLGEYATWNNKFYNALCEAAYMTSFELNADVVAMTCYAPLLCNVDYVNWKPDLIWYNNHQLFGIPSYYTQKMFSVNKGDVTLEVENMITAEDAFVPHVDMHGSIGFSAPADAAFNNIKLNGNSLTKDNMFFKKGDWSFNEGSLIRSYNAADYEGRPNNQSREADVSLDCNLSDFTLEFSFSVDEHEPPVDPSRPQRPWRFRRGVSFTFCDSGDRRFNWRMGSFRNDESALSASHKEFDDVISTKPFVFDNNREYSIKIQKQGDKVICFVDGEIFHEVLYQPVPVRRIYVSSSLDTKTNEVIIKAVNVRQTPVTLEVQVDNAGAGARTVKLESLTADSLDDTNTFEEPNKVIPKYSSFNIEAVPFTYTFPASSVNIFRIPIIK